MKRVERSNVRANVCGIFPWQIEIRRSSLYKFRNRRWKEGNDLFTAVEKERWFRSINAPIHVTSGGGRRGVGWEASTQLRVLDGWKLQDKKTVTRIRNVVTKFS